MLEGFEPYGLSGESSENGEAAEYAGDTVVTPPEDSVSSALLSDFVVPYALGWPLAVKIILALAIIAPLGLVMGRLFPQGLVEVSQDTTSYLPWAWAINGAMGTIAAGIAPLLAQAFGFKALLVSGAAVYLAVLLIPAYGRRPVPRAGYASSIANV